METRVTPHEVTAEFEALVLRARERGETLVVERDGSVLCRIVPAKKPYTAGEFAASLETLEWPDADFGKDLQAVIDGQEYGVPGSRWD